MSAYIPYELVLQILPRLATKSLIRFRLVCKGWYSLITNPNFIATHFKQTVLNRKIDNRALLLGHYNEDGVNELYTLHPEDDQTFKFGFPELDFPCKSSTGCYGFVGSCNGLICLSDDLYGDGETIIIWNPSIRKWVTLPKPSTPKWKCKYRSVLGFGMDLMTLGFKVVKILYYDLCNNGFDYQPCYTCFDYQILPQVVIYSLSTGSWRSIKAAPSYFMTGNQWSEAFVNGAVHWISYDKSLKSSCRSLVVSFDMTNEVFDEIMLPDALAHEFPSNLYVSIFGQSLAVISKGRSWDTTSVWVMKEYGVTESWTRVLDLDPAERCEKIIGFRMNGEVLLTISKPFIYRFIYQPTSLVGKLYSYDPNTGGRKRLEITRKTRPIYIQTYIETLVLLDG